MSWSIFFDVAVLLLSSLVTGPSLMSIPWLVLELRQFSFIMDWLEIQKLKIPVFVLPNIGRLGQVSDTKFGTNVSHKKLLNAAKCQRFSLCRFWINKGKPVGWGELPRKENYPPTHTPALKINILLVSVNWSSRLQSRRSSYLTLRSKDCFLPLTKTNENCGMWNSGD